jgi:ribokinase
MLTVVGDINVDLSLAVAGWPAVGGDTRAHTATWSHGGTGLNAAIAVVQLGGTCRLWGRVGADAVAEGVTTWAVERGVDISDVQVDRDISTGLCVIPVVPDGERTFLSFRGANVAWQYPTHWPAAPGWLHICGHALLEDPQRANSVRALHYAQRQGWQTSIDLCDPLAPHIGDILVQLPQALDCLLGNQHEMAMAQPQLQRSTLPRLIVTKRGAAGARITELDGSLRDFPGFPVDTQDTTACGDAFASTFVWSLSHGADSAAACTLANAVGALTASQRGGATSIPEMGAIEVLYAQHECALPHWVKMVR